MSFYSDDIEAFIVVLMANFFSTDGVIKNVRNPYDRSIKPFSGITELNSFSLLHGR